MHRCEVRMASVALELSSRLICHVHEEDFCTLLDQKIGSLQDGFFWHAKFNLATACMCRIAILAQSDLVWCRCLDVRLIQALEPTS